MVQTSGWVVVLLFVVEINIPFILPRKKKKLNRIQCNTLFKPGGKYKSLDCVVLWTDTKNNLILCKWHFD